ncbi:MAG: flagellar hook-associated protein FlgK [Bacteriovoracia bacterium]
MGADLLNIGKSGLFTAKQSMSTTSHNIANANTEGYSRQEVRSETGIALPEGDYVLGTGAEVQSIKRSHDELVEKKLNASITNHKFNAERSLQLGHVEEIFNEINSEGMNKVLNRFFNSFRELSNQPENETVRSVVKENAKIVVGDFHRIQQSLDDVRASINKKISLSVDEINGLTKNIAKLNKEINIQEVSGGMANDLRDQRDRAVRTLTEFFPISTYSDSEGQFVVSIEGVGSIVAGGLAQELSVGSMVKPGGNSADKGDVQIFFASRPGVSMSDNIKGGTLGAQLKTRNQEIVGLEKQVDELAHGLVLATNAIHRRGFANHPVPTDAEGNPIPNAASKKVTGINFFKEPLDLKRAAEYIQLSDEVESDVNNIATALEPNKPGDNRIALAVSKLQHEKVLGGGTTTFEEQYLKSVGNIGLQTGKSKIDEEQSHGILAQAKSFKERLAGVSLDEEAANMVRYQNAYEASAKVIRASDEMFKAVLGLMS